MTTNTADAATLALTALLLLPLGLAVGSFLNVVIWRVPQGMSVVRPPSACPRCGHAIRERDNVPVVSWLLLRGRCRDCQEPISVRYPLVEAATGVLFVATGLFTGPSWVLPGLLYLVSISIALALIDIDTRRLPDVIVLPSYLVALALLTLASWNPGGEADWGALVRALIGGAAMFALYLVLVLVYPAGMGRGDLKLSGVLGLYLGWFGWATLAFGWFAAYLLGGLFSIGLLLVGRAGRKSKIPFGPWMLLGALVGIAVGEAVGEWYLSLF
ncbi:prepilin peptidase [Cellulomonas soli]|uniref:Prepilin leader peptidase/N-methyltransferase n=1 Tax=Cellulomonas soli TaxID=931535 RepID=A0A512PA75_9CELL|nr:A24 family peptidase [Cellulomonas soli]NYI60603.1 leader peptidase (prepilin peptidase)/N-methyltransferase [Cellulomonas soli]GEP68118.1 prepilin peptidase [Cellulomonas soli]